MTVNHDVVGSSPTWGVDVSIEANEIVYGSVVKRLRHRPFTAVTRVRFSSESFKWVYSSESLCLGMNHADVAQLAEQLICNQQVTGSIPAISSPFEGFWTFSSVG